VGRVRARSSKKVQRKDRRRIKIRVKFSKGDARDTRVKQVPDSNSGSDKV
jgi:hypothetical protein